MFLNFVNGAVVLFLFGSQPMPLNKNLTANMTRTLQISSLVALIMNTKNGKMGSTRSN